MLKGFKTHVSSGLDQLCRVSSSWYATCVWWTSGRTFWCPWPWCLLDWDHLLYLHGWAASLEVAVLSFTASWGQGREREACVPNRQLLAGRPGIDIAGSARGGSPNWTPACMAATDEIQWQDFRNVSLLEFAIQRLNLMQFFGGERRGRQVKNPAKPTQNIFYFKYASD